MSVSEPEPVPPTVKPLLRCMSSQLWMPESVLNAQMLTSLVMLPIQVSLVGSKWTVPGLSSGSIARPRPKVAMTVPSRGATPMRYWITRRLPAPGMFCGTMAGWPGM